MNEFKQALDLIDLGKWEQAHNLTQQGNHKYHFLIHALLHRIEGDDSNAGYWYSRANCQFPNNSIQEEKIRIRQIVEQADEL